MSTTDKPFSQACENNKRPILEVLRQWLPDSGIVLEIGSGTGQHISFFAEALPGLSWQPSDQPGNETLAQAWIDSVNLPNIRPPLALNVAQPWPLNDAVDAVYSANTAHIMSWTEVEHFFAGVGCWLQHQGIFVLYGPFNENGLFTSSSNEQFDQMLRDRNPLMGIRDLDAIEALALDHGLKLVHRAAMPANNQILVFRKQQARA